MVKNLSSMRIAQLCACMLLLCLASKAMAHPMPESRVEATYSEKQWWFTLLLPTDRLVTALKETPTNDMLSDYVLKNIAVHSADDDDLVWQGRVLAVVPPKDDVDYYQVYLVFNSPEAVDTGDVLVNYGVISERIITHKAMFWLMQGKNLAPETYPPEFVGITRGNKRNILLLSS